MGVCTMHLRLASSCRDRFRRLGWLGLWIVGKHGMRIWMTTPRETGERMDWRLGPWLSAHKPRFRRRILSDDHRVLGGGDQIVTSATCGSFSASPKRLQRD